MIFCIFLNRVKNTSVFEYGPSPPPPGGGATTATLFHPRAHQVGTRDLREEAAGGSSSQEPPAKVKSSSARKTKRDEDISLSPGAHSLTRALFFLVFVARVLFGGGEEKVNDLSRLFLWARLCVYGGRESDGIWIIEVDARTKRVGRHCGILASLRF